jgi:hypothetical protein
MRTCLLLLASAFTLVACVHESGRKQHIEFAAFTVDEGVYKPKAGWTFTKGEKGTVIARQNTGPGIVITPCACSLETGGSCDQATIDDPNGDIKELWCIDNGCGFCVGGTVEPDDPASAVRFNVVCKAKRAAR